MQITTLEQVFGLPTVQWEDRHLLPEAAGVYFVFGDDLLIYIGKTEKTLRQRFRNHTNAPLMQYFGVLTIAWVAIEDHESVRQEEARLVRLFEPALNVSHIPKAYARMAKEWPHLREGWDRNRRPVSMRAAPHPGGGAD